MTHIANDNQAPPEAILPVTLFDEPPKAERTHCPCGARLETSHERHYGECWLCLRLDA